MELNKNIKALIILACIVGFFFANFYEGDFPIRNLEDFSGWLVGIGVITYFSSNLSVAFFFSLFIVQLRYYSLY